MMYPVIELALAMAGVGAIGALLSQLRKAHLVLPVVLVAGLGVAGWYRAIHEAFALDLLLYDAPWPLGLGLAAWAAAGASGFVRARSWPAVVLGAALFGDVAITTGLALAEPDEGRRARLVLAANGASLMAPWSSATTLALGWGGTDAVLLGLALAALGYVGGGTRPEFARPQVARAWPVALAVVWMVLLTWLMALGNVLDFVSYAMEGLPPLQPGRATPAVGVVAVLAGVVGAEPLNALVAEHSLALATTLRGTWAADALRIGLVVGSGLPALLLSGGRVTTGLPLWVGQVLLALGFLAWRYHV